MNKRQAKKIIKRYLKAKGFGYRRHTLEAAKRLAVNNFKTAISVYLMSGMRFRIGNKEFNAENGVLRVVRKFLGDTPPLPAVVNLEGMWTNT